MSAAPSAVTTTPDEERPEQPEPGEDRDGRVTRGACSCVRPSPRATAALSVPQPHSEPAIAAPYVTASSPPMPSSSARISLVRGGEGHELPGGERRHRVRRRPGREDHREQ